MVQYAFVETEVYTEHIEERRSVINVILFEFKAFYSRFCQKIYLFAFLCAK